MNSYGGFAYIYDKLIEQDYGKWVNYIEEIFKKYNLKPELILDLACGTGSITTKLAQKGYDMIGVDLSEDMLAVAMEKAVMNNLDIRYLCQDMTEFELYGTVDAIICTLDAVNYVTQPKKLANMFSLVRNYLNPNGLFVFDINTEYKLKNILGNNSFIYDTEDVFYTWENEFDDKLKLSNQILTFFVANGAKYNRIDEIHVQRCYSNHEITRPLNDAGLTLEGCFKIFTFDDSRQNDEKIVFVAKYLC